MPLIKTVRVQNIRTHKEYSLDLSPNVTVITGPNGSGKTSIIEAVYIALQGSSFKSGDGDILRRDAIWYRIDITLDDDTVRTVKFDSEKQTGRKQFEINGKTHYRLSYQHKLPLVLFEPDDLRLLNGSPARRRQFIDQFIGQLDPEYIIASRRYERALKQRNTLLKGQYNSADNLFAWNVSLSKYGAYIISQRNKFISTIQQKLGDTYRGISGTADDITITYSHTYSGSLEQKLLSELENHTEKDKILGFTSTGPHRHDVLFGFNHSAAILGASRGEVRTIILALKFIEVAIIESLTGKKPLILLDDVFSELDKDRQNHLIKFTKNHQIVLSSATDNTTIKTKYVAKL